GAAFAAPGRPCSRASERVSSSNSSITACAIRRMYLARSLTRRSAHSGCTRATAPTTSAIRSGEVAVTLPSGSPVAGSRACMVARVPAWLSVALMSPRLSPLQATRRANLRKPPRELRLRLVGLVEVGSDDAVWQDLLWRDVPGMVVRVVVIARLLPHRSEIGQRTG